ncbi:hypothetical protein TELCIR_10222 [Teladorsagia circumcincta]|uniref:Ras family protein n=1 Tax=Teladorsagia circumcincta TaxID=45464 RepID=A0A2G9UE46_TELCI|nr:hypothetical protein TELCIR_10222 [Teladorsagia circumcincta]
MKDTNRPPKKILVLGPCKAGKTAISNYLGEQVDIESLGEYRPTKGVRIVEFESHELDIRRQRIEVDVELWDCSGDPRYDEFIASSNLDPENILIVLNEMGEKRTNDTAISEFRTKSHFAVSFDEGEKACNDGWIEIAQGLRATGKTR